MRAKSVVDYLRAKGVSADRIHSAGYGLTRPVASNNSEDGRAKNRRIEFKVRKN
jgi:outer membrane protein OmpA-like peptidoglycan-associated protein